MTDFFLIPFLWDETVPEIALTGQMERRGSQLFLTMQMTGKLSQIAISNPVVQPSRQDNLWQTTCFECFLGFPDDTPYWELNLSPSGHWNCYRFSDYRQGMVAETTLTILPFQIDRSPQGLTLQINLDLGSLIAPSQPLIAGISSVIQTVHGNLSYWALTHPGSEPDFHRRDSFQLYFP